MGTADEECGYFPIRSVDTDGREIHFSDAQDMGSYLCDWNRSGFDDDGAVMFTASESRLRVIVLGWEVVLMHEIPLDTSWSDLQILEQHSATSGSVVYIESLHGLALRVLEESRGKLTALPERWDIASEADLIGTTKSVMGTDRFNELWCSARDGSQPFFHLPRPRLLSKLRRAKRDK